MQQINFIWETKGKKKYNKKEIKKAIFAEQ